MAEPAPYVIPTLTDGTAHYVFTTELDGATFELELLWVERTPAWYLSVSLEDGTRLLSSRRLVLGTGITFRYKNPRLPKGDFWLFDTTGQDAEPGLYDLGARVLLLYGAAEDLGGSLR